jgi:Ni/Co efflux regulator RcnB
LSATSTGPRPTGRDNVGTVEDLHASATRMTGLSDFGDHEYLDGLEVLLASYAQDAGLTPEGNKAHRALLRGALVARLFSEQGWQAHPEHADVAIERPIFVTGLPRTGTTALHRLLTADPGHQGLELWLAEMPQPRPPRESWEQNPIFAGIQAGYQRHHLERPEYMGLHYMSADQVEECWQLLRQSMRSISYESLAHLPTYSAWLRGQDWTPAYRRHRRNLQLIGLPDAGRRWVLKNPSHLFALDALLEVYPDALVIQTHRDPRTAIASMASLSVETTRGWSTTFQGALLGATQLELWARGLEDFIAARARHPQAQFLDVDYDEFVADPVGTAESVYSRFGLPLTEAARTAIRDLHSSSLTGERRPSHRYTLADVNLTPEQVDARFQFLS